MRNRLPPQAEAGLVDLVEVLARHIESRGIQGPMLSIDLPSSLLDCSLTNLLATGIVRDRATAFQRLTSAANVSDGLSGTLVEAFEQLGPLIDGPDGLVLPNVDDLLSFRKPAIHRRMKSSYSLDRAIDIWRPCLINLGTPENARRLLSCSGGSHAEPAPLLVMYAGSQEAELERLLRDKGYMAQPMLTAGSGGSPLVLVGVPSGAQSRSYVPARLPAAVSYASGGVGARVPRIASLVQAAVVSFPDQGMQSVIDLDVVEGAYAVESDASSSWRWTGPGNVFEARIGLPWYGAAEVQIRFFENDCREAIGASRYFLNGIEHEPNRVIGHDLVLNGWVDAKTFNGQLSVTIATPMANLHMSEDGRRIGLCISGISRVSA